MNPVSRRTILKTVGAGGILLVGGASATGAQMGGQEDTALFRVGHFSPDTPVVNVLIDDEPFPELQGVPYGALSSYFVVPADTYNVKVVLTGEMIEGEMPTSNETSTETAMTPTETETGMTTTESESGMTTTETTTSIDEDRLVIDEDLTLDADSAYTIVAADELDNISAVVLEDNEEPASDSQAKVRFGHFSSDAPAVDITLANGDDLASNLEFSEVSGYEVLDAGVYSIDINDAQNQEAVASLTDVELMGDQVYSVFVIGYVAPQGPELPGLSVLSSNDTLAQQMAREETTTETPSGNETTTSS
ncbi:DUF4397 domain-containing protein [Haloferax sp. DFSO60]|uniref:DUF4397 domain-containing protein n=1 Tax=Haloferax sp. DFSO60 TaxID=3388652 RepID=UPI0039785A05